MMEPLFASAAISAAIFVLAGTAQAVSGFGLALAAVPLLSFTVETEAAVVGTVMVMTAITGMAWWRERAHTEPAVARRLSLTAIAGMPVGLAVIAVLPERSLTLLIGIVVLVLVAALACKVRLPTGVPTQRVAGVASGALLTSTSMNGPPLVLVLHGSGMSPRCFRATLQAVFCVQAALGVVGFAVLGHISSLAAAVAVGGCTGVPLGWAAGDRLFHRIAPATFRVVVLVGLAVSALMSLRSALLG